MGSFPFPVDPALQRERRTAMPVMATLPSFSALVLVLLVVVLAASQPSVASAQGEAWQQHAQEVQNTEQRHHRHHAVAAAASSANDEVSQVDWKQRLRWQHQPTYHHQPHSAGDSDGDGDAVAAESIKPVAIETSTTTTRPVGKWPLPTRPVKLEPFALPSAALKASREYAEMHPHEAAQGRASAAAHQFEKERDILQDVQRVLQQGSWAVPGGSGDWGKSESRWDIIQEVVGDSAVFSALELGSGNGALSVALARKYEETITVLSVGKQQIVDELHVPLRDSKRVKNNVVATAVDLDRVFPLPRRSRVGGDATSTALNRGKNTSHSTPADAVVAPWYSYYDFDLVIISDLEALSNNLLPHELEQLVASIILKARVTFVQAPLPDTRFFSYWEDVKSLVDKAVKYLKRTQRDMLGLRAADPTTVACATASSSDAEEPDTLVVPEVKLHKHSGGYWGPELEKYVSVQWLPTPSTEPCAPQGEDPQDEGDVDSGDSRGGDGESSLFDMADEANAEDSQDETAPVPVPPPPPAFYRETYISSRQLAPFRILDRDRAFLFRQLLQDCSPLDAESQTAGDQTLAGTGVKAGSRQGKAAASASVTSEKHGQSSEGYYLIQGQLKLHTPRLLREVDPEPSGNTTAVLPGAGEVSAQGHDRHSDISDHANEESEEYDEDEEAEEAEDDKRWEAWLWGDGSDAASEWTAEDEVGLLLFDDEAVQPGAAGVDTHSVGALDSHTSSAGSENIEFHHLAFVGNADDVVAEDDNDEGLSFDTKVGSADLGTDLETQKEATGANAFVDNGAVAASDLTNGDQGGDNSADTEETHVVVFDGMEVEYTDKDARDLRILLADYAALVSLSDPAIVKLVLQTKQEGKLGDAAYLSALNEKVQAQGGEQGSGSAGTGRRLLGYVRKSISFHKFRLWQYLERLGNNTKLEALREKEAEKDAARDNSWSTSHREEQSARSMEEDETYAGWKSILAAENLPANNPWTLLTYGSYLSLLSVRLARSFPESTVVAAHRTEQSAAGTLKMAQLLELRNLFVCQSDLNYSVASALEQPGDPFAYQVLDLDVFEGIISGGAGNDDWAFERLLGKLLRLAHTTFLRIPPWPTLMQSLKVLEHLGAANDERGGSSHAGSGLNGLGVFGNVGVGSTPGSSFGSAFRGAAFSAYARQFRAKTCPTELCYERAATQWSFFSGLVAAAAALEGIGPVSLSFVSSDPDGLHALRISLGEDATSGASNGSPSMGTQVRDDTGGLEHVSLYSLLHLGVVPKVRAELFRLFMQMDVSYDDHASSDTSSDSSREYIIAPWNVRYHLVAGGGLLLADDLVRKHLWKDPLDDKRLEPILAQIESIETAKQRPVERGRFSFLEWNSGVGSLSLGVAQRYPRATVVSVTASDVGATEHLEAIARLNVSNSRVCKNSDVGYPLLSTFYESPEFLRYQVIGTHILDLVKMSDAGKVLGKWLALALTTFLQMPTDEHLSLGLTLFGPSRPAAFADSLSAFSMHFHPNEAYTQGGVRLLSSLARLRGRNHVRFAQHDHGVLQFDIVAMNRSVGHHFNWQIDGHDRKYKMHVARNVTAEKELAAGLTAPSGAAVNLTTGNHLWPHGQVSSVYLTRALDGSHIPYDTIYGITLIAMLRLGLVREQRSVLYEEFLKLPLFEDMAPWNIVIVGSSVGYIDYDTRAHTFDKDLQSVYRVMSAMFNYKVRVSYGQPPMIF